MRTGKRMSDQIVIGKQKFMSMDFKAQALYQQLNSASDGYGFVEPNLYILGLFKEKRKGTPFLKELEKNGYIISFGDVVVISHFNLVNTISKFKQGICEYPELLKKLKIVNGVYELLKDGEKPQEPQPQQEPPKPQPQPQEQEPPPKQGNEQNENVISTKEELIKKYGKNEYARVLDYAKNNDFWRNKTYNLKDKKAQNQAFFKHFETMHKQVIAKKYKEYMGLSSDEILKKQGLMSADDDEEYDRKRAEYLEKHMPKNPLTQAIEQENLTDENKKYTDKDNYTEQEAIERLAFYEKLLENKNTYEPLYRIYDYSRFIEIAEHYITKEFWVEQGLCEHIFRRGFNELIKQTDPQNEKYDRAKVNVRMETLYEINPEYKRGDDFRWIKATDPNNGAFDSELFNSDEDPFADL